jgi:hypothetical protein
MSGHPVIVISRARKIPLLERDLEGYPRRDSNPQPSDPKSDALSIELRGPIITPSVPETVRFYHARGAASGIGRVPLLPRAGMAGMGQGGARAGPRRPT